MKHFTFDPNDPKPWRPAPAPHPVSPRSALWLLCAASWLACSGEATETTVNPDGDANGTDTGNPFEDDDNQAGEGNGFGNCEQTETDVDPAAQTALGFAPQALIDLVSGEHVTSLAWLESNTPYGPESGRSELTLSVEAVGSPRWVDRSPRQSGGPQGEIGLAYPYGNCNDSIELDLRITLRSAGGALDEVAETTIQAHSVDFARTSLSVPLDEIAGSFEAEVQAPANSELTGSSLTVQIGFTEHGVTGAMALSTEFRSPDGMAVGVGASDDIAHFPADNYCGVNAVSVTADQSVRGLSMSSLLDNLNELSPAPVSYEGGGSSELMLSFATDQERICARFDESGPGSVQLEFPGVATLASNDGRIEGDVPVQYAGASTDGVLTITAQGNVQADSASQATPLAAQFGIQDPVDFSGYDGGRVEFFANDDGSGAGGSLRVYGLDVADCVNNPPPPDPNGMGAPGCRGTDRILLWGAQWGDVY